MSKQTTEYINNHARVRAERGLASAQACVDCGGPAREWSFRLGTDPTEVQNYDPRCLSCHRSHDMTPEHREKIRQGMLRYHASRSALTSDSMENMATATKKPGMTAALSDVSKAFKSRRELAGRLADQDRYIGKVVRDARAEGHTWQAIADEAGTSDVAVIKASRRPEKV